MMPDAHVRPPDSIREIFKTWRKLGTSQIDAAPDIIDPYNPDLLKVSWIHPSKEPPSYLDATTDGIGTNPAIPVESPAHPAFEIKGLPGMLEPRPADSR